MKNTHQINIYTERFYLRPLTELDVTEKYLSWLSSEDSKKFIVASKKTTTLADLKDYVKSKIEDDNAIFLGIFEKENHLHIGNIKYEPIDWELKTAMMGIFIGDLEWQSKGVAKEVIKATIEFLKVDFNIKIIKIGVFEKNSKARKLYSDLGFVEIPNSNLDQNREFLAERGSSILMHLYL